MKKVIDDKEFLFFERGHNFNKGSIFLIILSLILLILYINDYLFFIKHSNELFGFILLSLIPFGIILPLFNNNKEISIDRHRNISIKHKAFFRKKITNEKIKELKLSTDIGEADVGISDVADFISKLRIKNSYKKFVFTLEIKTGKGNTIKLHITSLPLKLFPASGLYQEIPKTEDAKFNMIVNFIGPPLEVNFGDVHNPVPKKIISQIRKITPRVDSLKLIKKEDRKMILKTINNKIGSFSSIIQVFSIIILIVPFVLILIYLNVFILLAYILFLLVPGFFLLHLIGVKKISIIKIDKENKILTIYNDKTEEVMHKINIDDIKQINVWQKRSRKNRGSDELSHFYTVELDGLEILFAYVSIARLAIFSIPVLPAYQHKVNKPNKNLYEMAKFLDVPIVNKN